MAAPPGAERVRRSYCVKNGYGELKDWAGKFAGEDCIVCGLGVSLNEFAPCHPKAEPTGWNPADFWTIGVNDHGRCGWNVDFLLLLDRLNSMDAERAALVRESRPGLTFQRLPNEADYLPDHHTVVEYDIQNRQVRRNPTCDPELEPDWLEHEHLPHQDTSPFTAAALAVRLGFKRIGVIGVDLGFGYAWDPGGPHRHALYEGHKDRITFGFAELAQAAKERFGVEVVQLAKETQVDWGCRDDISSIEPKAKGSRRTLGT